jgi:hypothetical protein
MLLASGSRRSDPRGPATAPASPAGSGRSPTSAIRPNCAPARSVPQPPPGRRAPPAGRPRRGQRHRHRRWLRMPRAPWTGSPPRHPDVRADRPVVCAASPDALRSGPHPPLHTPVPTLTPRDHRRPVPVRAAWRPARPAADAGHPSDRSHAGVPRPSRRPPRTAAGRSPGGPHPATLRVRPSRSRACRSRPADPAAACGSPAPPPAGVRSRPPPRRPSCRPGRGSPRSRRRPPHARSR